MFKLKHKLTQQVQLVLNQHQRLVIMTLLLISNLKNHLFQRIELQIMIWWMHKLRVFRLQQLQNRYKNKPNLNQQKQKQKCLLHHQKAWFKYHHKLTEMIANIHLLISEDHNLLMLILIAHSQAIFIMIGLMHKWYN